MPRLSYFTPAEQACFAKLNTTHTYRTRYDLTLTDDSLVLPQELLDLMLKRCPLDFYDSLTRRPLQKPDEFLVEPTIGAIPSLRFYDITAAVIAERNIDETTIGVLTPDHRGRIVLPLTYIIKANLREAKPKGQLVLAPFHGYDTFGLWTLAQYEKAIKKT